MLNGTCQRNELQGYFRKFNGTSLVLNSVLEITPFNSIVSVRINTQDMYFTPQLLASRFLIETTAQVEKHSGVLIS